MSPPSALDPRGRRSPAPARTTPMITDTTTLYTCMLGQNTIMHQYQSRKVMPFFLFMLAGCKILK